MQNVSLGKKRLKGVSDTLATFTLFVSMCLPFQATALEASPTQILPPAQGKSCPVVNFSDIQPFIYDNKLDSFEVTVSNPGYIAITTAVNGSPIPYHYITRWQNPDGSVRMHVDLPSVALRNGASVDIVFLGTAADTNGLPLTCIMNISSSVGGASNATGGNGRPHEEGGYVPITKPHYDGSENPDQGVSTSTIESASDSSNVGLVAVTNSLGKLCAKGGSTRLWVVLLLLYAIFVVSLLAQKIEPGDLGREWNMALILAIFLALLIFWYVSAVCRTGPWAPALSTCIAVAGLIYSMLLQDDGQHKILLLKKGEGK